MEKKAQENLLRRCFSLLPEFYDYIKISGDDEKKLKIIKGHISLFLKELRITSRQGFTSKSLNSQFVNNYLTRFIPNRFPNYSNKKILFIRKLLKTYFIYLTTKRVFEKKNTQELIRNLYTELELEKEIKTNLKEENKNESKKGFKDATVSSSHMNQIITIKNKIFKFLNSNLKEDDLDESLELLVTFLLSKPEKVLVQAILELVESIEDPNLFWRINILVQDFLNMRSLPSRIINILENKSKRDEFFYRLLIIYQGFFYSGYLLEKDFQELIEDLEVDMGQLYAYISTLAQEIPGLTDISKKEPSKNIQNVLQILEKEIEIIKPFKKNVSCIDDKTITIFNFPEGYDIDIQKHVSHLESILDSHRDMLDFVKSSYDNLESYFSKSECKKLLRKTQRSYYEGKHREALLFINKLLKKVPENSVAHYFKAKVLEAQGKNFNALKYILWSLKIDPLKVETYMDLAHLLEAGGYFHQSLALTSLFIQIFPFDFNFCLQLAISSSQLLFPFKYFLKLAGAINPARTLNFLDRYWPLERFKSKDSMKELGISREKFNKLRDSAKKIVLNAIKVLKGIDFPLRDEALLEKLNSIIRNPLYFFPVKSEHILKNWFIYELTQRLAMIFYKLYPNFFYVIANERFINFCFQISKTASQFIYRKISASKITTLDLFPVVVNTISH